MASQTDSEPLASQPLTSWGYVLRVTHHFQRGFRFDLEVSGSDDQTHQLNVRNPRDPQEVQEAARKVLRAIANRWPESDWKFSVNEQGQISDAEGQSADAES